MTHHQTSNEAERTDRLPVDLSSYHKGKYAPGRSRWLQLLWYVTSALLFESKWFPLSRAKCALLRLYGAQIGCGVVIKPDVRIKFPWRLTIGDYSWIGESAWIDNLAPIVIGSHVCVSQGVYLCTGSHDYRRSSFDLITKPITIEDGAWLCARSVVLPGVTVGTGAVISAGSVIARDVPAHMIVSTEHSPHYRPRDPVPSAEPGQRSSAGSAFGDP